MLRNYLYVALRTLRRHAVYSFINIAGLAIGMACCVLILLYVRDERGYDRFHEDADRLYRLRVERFASGGEAELSALSSPPMMPAARADFPQIEHAVRIGPRTYLVEQDDRRFYEDGFLWADSSFFDVFSFELLRGDPATVLAAPYSVVLTDALARKYFGAADPVGQTLQVDAWTMTVTGVAADPPAQSHFTFDLLGSFTTLEALNGSPSTEWGWWGLSFATYLRLAPEADPEALQAGLHEMPARYVGDQERESGYRQFLYLQPITDIHLHSHYMGELAPNGDVAYVYVFSAVAVFILLLACINFMNLSTARAAQRAREVGLRKVVGAGKGQLVGQFLGESVLLAGLALVLAVGLIYAVLPGFNQLTQKALAFSLPAHVPLLVGLVLGVGVLAGLYPAFVLSAFRPVSVLKGQGASGAGGAWLRKGLVVFQFAVSVMLVAGAFIAFQQLRYMRTRDLGFQKEQVLALNFRGHEDLQAHREAFKEALEAGPGVRATAFSSAVPGRMRGNSNVISRSRGMNDEGQTMPILAVDPDFAETYGLELLAGRDLSREYATDDSLAFLINEAALRALGWSRPEEAVGQELTRQFGDPREVVGVVRDFHLRSLQHAIEPLVFMVEPTWTNYVSVRLETTDVAAAVAHVERVWNTFAEGRPLDYFFVDDDYDRQYRAEERAGAILSLFTGLAVLIACLGLFGLASYTTALRTKEIGVRKVLGATAPQVVLLLGREVTLLVGLGILLAVPVAYFGMERWLHGFAYRMTIGPDAFLVAGLAALLIAWATVAVQTLRAALANPVDALREG